MYRYKSMPRQIPSGLCNQVAMRIWKRSGIATNTVVGDMQYIQCNDSYKTDIAPYTAQCFSMQPKEPRIALMAHPKHNAGPSHILYTAPQNAALIPVCTSPNVVNSKQSPPIRLFRVPICRFLRPSISTLCRIPSRPHLLPQLLGSRHLIHLLHHLLRP